MAADHLLACRLERFAYFCRAAIATGTAIPSYNPFTVKGNGRIVTIIAPIPASYTCDPTAATDCWFKIKASFAGGGLGFTFGSWGSDIRDIVPLALPDGPIQPGAAVRGFLYFPRPAPDTQGVRLVAVFPDIPGTPQLEFRFRRAE